MPNITIATFRDADKLDLPRVGIIPNPEEEKEEEVRKYERLTAITACLGGMIIMYYAWHTLKIGTLHIPGAGFLPFLCGAGLVILGIVRLLIFQWKKEQEREGPGEKRMWRRPLLSLLLMVLYGWMMETAGYITSTLIFMVAWQQIIEREKWLKTMIISLLGTFAMYALFVYLLRVPVPEEFLFK